MRNGRGKTKEKERKRWEKEMGKLTISNGKKEGGGCRKI